MSVTFATVVITNMLVHLQDRQQREEELKAKEAELLRGNPLLNNPTSFSVKRRLVAGRSSFQVL